MLKFIKPHKIRKILRYKIFIPLKNCNGKWPFYSIFPCKIAENVSLLLTILFENKYLSNVKLNRGLMNIDSAEINNINNLSTISTETFQHRNFKSPL